MCSGGGSAAGGSALPEPSRLDDLGLLPLLRYPARTVIDDAWMQRDNLTAYDAQYLALARLLPAELLTTDERMAKAAHAARVTIYRG